MEEKTGQRARLRIDADQSVRVNMNDAGNKGQFIRSLTKQKAVV